MEKLNDDARRIVRHKSANWNACADVMLVKGRQKDLQDKDRTKRTYGKKDVEYWTTGIFAQRQKRKHDAITMGSDDRPRKQCST